MKYKVILKPLKQDSITFIDVTDPDYKFPDWLDYDYVLEYSKKTQGIENENDIKSFCYGSDKIEPYFSAMTAAKECEILLDMHGVDFDPEVDYYDLYEDEPFIYK